MSTGTNNIAQRQALRRDGAPGLAPAPRVALSDYTSAGQPVSADTAAFAASLGIPDGTDLLSDPAAVTALSSGAQYVAGAAAPDPGVSSNINNWIQTAAYFSTLLGTAYAGASSANQAAYSAAYANTQNNIANFQDIGQQLMTDTSNTAKIAQWVAVGQSIIGNANTLSNALGVPAVTFNSLWQGFPQSLSDVTAWAGNKAVAAVKFLVNAAGQVTKQAAWSTAEIALVIGGTAIALLWGLNKFGGINAGAIAGKFLGFGGYGAHRRKLRSRTHYRSRGRSQRRKLHGRKVWRGRGSRGFLGARTGLWLTLAGAVGAYFAYRALVPAAPASASATSGLADYITASTAIRTHANMMGPRYPSGRRG